MAEGCPPPRMTTGVGQARDDRSSRLSCSFCGNRQHALTLLSPVFVFHSAPPSPCTFLSHTPPSAPPRPWRPSLPVVFFHLSPVHQLSIFVSRRLELKRSNSRARSGNINNPVGPRVKPHWAEGGNRSVHEAVRSGKTKKKTGEMRVDDFGGS